MATSVRLDPKTERLLERLAKRRGWTKSEVLRSAIAALSGLEDEERTESEPFSLVEDLVGCVRGGARNLSERTGRRFGDLLRAKPRQRRA